MEKYEKKGQTSVCILVVEDNESHRELIEEAIKEANPLNSTLCVEDGREALRYLHRDGEYGNEERYPKPDLILLDLKLPGMDGKNVLREIKSDDRTRVVPVIMLTSSAHDKDVDECYKLGASGYITKPISFTDFVALVRTIPFYWTFVNKLPNK